ncbi:MAG: metalloregulator ArsR/SmtB family transcription factor [Paracoccaceae bacterium]|nr:metalloregulator ArsR/SmtB family transcription factor [Paracoccaceae bacterium]
MPNSQASFRALADPTRRAIISRLSTGEMTITQAVADFEMTRTAVRKHLTVLEQGALINIRPVGRERQISLRPEGLRLVADWVGEFSRFWDDKLSALQTAIHEEDKS